jgi:hypothetical protein
MEWGNMMVAVSAGVTAVYTIQRLIAKLKTQPPMKPLSNSERSSLVSTLDHLEQNLIEQNVTMGRIEGRLNQIEDRIRPIERMLARTRGREFPTQGSTG